VATVFTLIKELLVHKLPSNEISLVPITQVFELDKGDVLKLCPRLKANVITPNHFEKMNTSLSVALLSHDVAAAILYQISAKNIEAKHQTTAWFLTHSLHSIVMLLKSGQKRRANTRYFVKFVLQHSAADLQVSFCHVQQYIADVQCSDEIVPIAVSLVISVRVGAE
jgi:hypothetical protein